MTRTPCLSLVLAAAVSAQEKVAPVAPAQVHYQGVYIAEADAGGALWVRGERYKLGLSADGAAFQPLFGPKAKRDFPLQLTLAGCEVAGQALPLAAATPWQRHGEGFARARGPVQECWRVTPGAAQQYFVVERPAAAGALALRIEARSDLMAVGDGPGVRFVAPGLGHVHYSDAVVIDANGEQFAVPVELAAGTLVIVVPQAVTENAAWPLVVDPFLTTVSVDTSVSDIQDPVVTCEPSTGNWLVVAEEHLSATSVDIICYRYDSSPTPVLLDTVYAENGADRGNNPGVGFVAQAQQFIVNWHNATAGNFQWRTRAAASAVMGTAFAYSAGIGADLDNRAFVGSTLTSDRFLTVSFRQNATGNDIIATLWRNTGTSFGTTFVGPVAFPSQATVEPGDVSVAASLADKWVVVWRECTSATCTSQLVRMQAIASNNGFGPLTGEPAVTLATESFADHVRIAGHTGKLLAVWRALDGTTNSNDIHGVPIAITGGVHAAQGAVQNLTAQEIAAIPLREQFQPSVSYDGCRFVYGYLEDDGTDLLFPFASTVFVSGPQIEWHEGHLALSTVPGLGCRSFDLGYGGTGTAFGHHWAVWQQDSPTFTGNVRAAVIDARAPGGTVAIDQTGCGLPTEPAISIAGTPALARSVTITVAAPAGFPFLLVGTQQITPLPFCGTCQSGISLAGMLAFAGPSLVVNIPNDLNLWTAQLSFQGLTMLQTGGCPASFFGFDFALSDTLTIRVL